MNLQTGYKEAKILDESDGKTEIQEIPGEQLRDDEKKSDVVVDEARKRLEEALSKIPADIYTNENTEEKWKELSKKYRSYKEIKEDLKDLELQMKSENEIMNELVIRFGEEKTTIEDKLIILEDIEFLAHSMDNSLHLISIGGVEKVIIPNFNDSNLEIRNKCFRLVGVILQNNNEAQRYASESTNIGEHLISALSRAINYHQETSVNSLLFAYGSLIRNNQKVSQDLLKKGFALLMQVIISGNSNFPLSLKTRAVVLIGDTLLDEKMKSELDVYVKGTKVCNQLDNYFALNRNGLIADIDVTDKFLNSLSDLQNICQHEWTESSQLRHNLLIFLSHFRTQHQESNDEDSKYLFTEIIEQLEKLNKFLFGHLTINEDDLNSRYGEVKTEL